MKTYNNPPQNDWNLIQQRPLLDKVNLENTVQEVLNSVKTNGDESLRHYTSKFDGVDLENLEVSELEIEEANKTVDEPLKEAIKKAYHNIKAFHEAQRKSFNPVQTSPGVKCWQRQTPIEKVGIYIPGGTAPLFSTVLMLAIPAKIAGCKEVVLCSPPDKDGKLPAPIIYAALLSGVTKMIKVGGAQAIAALAYGTQTVPNTYKIFGPGNQYVTAAKQLVFRDGIGIDLPAGPSELLVYADSNADPAFVASDLLSQAEHGVDSQVVLVCSNELIAAASISEVERQVENLDRKEIARKALEKSTCVILPDPGEAVDFINSYAPEHLILAVEDYLDVSDKILNAGSVFLGNYTPESAGDYASGTNHTLPTNGYARAFSGVTLDSFMKTITFQEITKEGIQDLGPTVEIMAENEQLDAHKNAVSIRLSKVGYDV